MRGARESGTALSARGRREIGIAHPGMRAHNIGVTMYPPAPVDKLDEDNPNRPGWQPDPERDGWERWWDGQQFTRWTHKSPRPGAAFDPNWKRTFWPGPNLDARIARYGLVATLATFFVQAWITTAEVVGLGFAGVPTIVGSIVIASIAAVVTIIFGYRGMKRADRLGGRASAVAALTVAVVLGATPLSFLLAYALMGFQLY